MGNRASRSAPGASPDTESGTHDDEAVALTYNVSLIFVPKDATQGVAAKRLFEDITAASTEAASDRSAAGVLLQTDNWLARACIANGEGVSLGQFKGHIPNGSEEQWHLWPNSTVTLSFHITCTLPRGEEINKYSFEGKTRQRFGKGLSGGLIRINRFPPKPTWSTPAKRAAISIVKFLFVPRLLVWLPKEKFHEVACQVGVLAGLISAAMLAALLSVEPLFKDAVQQRATPPPPPPPAPPAPPSMPFFSCADEGSCPDDRVDWRNAYIISAQLGLAFELVCLFTTIGVSILSQAPEEFRWLLPIMLMSALWELLLGVWCCSFAVLASMQQYVNRDEMKWNAIFSWTCFITGCFFSLLIYLVAFCCPRYLNTPFWQENFMHMRKTLSENDRSCITTSAAREASPSGDPSTPSNAASPGPVAVTPGGGAVLGNNASISPVAQPEHGLPSDAADAEH